MLTPAANPKPFVCSQRKRLGLIDLRKEMGQILMLCRIEQDFLFSIVNVQIASIKMRLAARHDHPRSERRSAQAYGGKRGA
jgi:hypothetical protein